MNHRNHSLLCLLLTSMFFAGCSAASESIVDSTPPVELPSAVVQSPPSPPSKPVSKSPDLAEPASRPTVQFSPPFPDRLELFEPPQRAQKTARRDDAGETVELKGFVNVDQPRVVLAIDGVISPIGEGGEKYGVQVISIQPPSVVLQRGRNRWTATLE